MNKETVEKDKDGNIIIKEVNNTDDDELEIIDEVKEKKEIKEEGTSEEIIVKEKKEAAKEEDIEEIEEKKKEETEKEKEDIDKGETKEVKKEGEDYEEWIYKDQHSEKQVEKGSRKALTGVVIAVLVILGIIFLPQLIGEKTEQIALDIGVIGENGNSIVKGITVEGKQYSPQTEILLAKGSYAVEIAVKDSPIEKIIIEDFAVQNKSSTIKIGEIKEPPLLKDMDVQNSFTITSENIPANTRFSKKAQGEKLFHCPSWKEGKCSGGEWIKVTDTEEGKEYKANLEQGAYIEGNEKKIKIVI